ncbi:membrane-bound transcription factor site-2 protease homolog isoform X3 [Manihot esculenta]|uniref:Endopeptidase S2P n=2 Tax=Manihot esculenta TaxID=3983 RepID=A0A251ISR2_MANES|nr:membrane-bound transcription factor site-2 protease homolog isoform X3 [Manihot esculenta]KAG8633816.1 hypothetical protein MANES_18G124500v8 [Manihot esculenta]OAY24000.1 hypothetical protein MANES_18G124500v8 [Manihot esculenta]OAY24001.1 hypothetical protein MANES_18G124500v8 [Manihot esculenta]
MEERRVRRYGRGQTNTLLPLRTAETRIRRLSNTISCWYCDYKISALNVPLFRFGRRHAGFLRVWFSIGVGFTLTALVVVTLILLWVLGSSLQIFRGNTELSNILSSIIFGFSPRVYALRLSLADASYLLLSTLISISVHEFGHALAAASEGIQVEYIAIFVAVLFPGALVAFNYELLQILERFAALRLYCAGIWHNAVCCAACGLVLFLLPLILCPFYMHGNRPMVFDVPSTSPLSGYLSPGDVIMSLDGKHIHNEQEWMEMTSVIHERALQHSNHSENSIGFAMIHNRKGYCVPTSLIEESKKIHLVYNQSSCPDDLTEFVAIQCYGSSKLDDVSNGDDHLNKRESRLCLKATDVVKLNKCSDGWVTEITNGSSCICSQDETCLSPVELPGLIWAEITYSSPYSPECLQVGRKSFPHSETADFTEDNCGGTFVFVGDVISMAHSIHLTSYQPRWAFGWSAYIPKVLEKSLIFTFQVSLTLALLNSLPVYFLDGESILEAALCHFTLLGPRKRAEFLRACLLGGTIICVLAFVRIFFFNFL